MKEKGEATLLSILCLVLLTSVLTLSALKLQHSYRLLQKRTKLFLCVKETKEEMNRYLVFMGRTNWGIKNILKVSLIMAFIPGLQGAALEVNEVRKLLKKIQDLSLIAYLEKVRELKARGCPLDPRMIITPFEVGPTGYIRNSNGSARLRNKKWDYVFVKSPYFINLSIDSGSFEAVWPTLRYRATEKGEKLSFLSSSPY